DEVGWPAEGRARAGVIGQNRCDLLVSILGDKYGQVMVHRTACGAAIRGKARDAFGPPKCGWGSVLQSIPSDSLQSINQVASVPLDMLQVLRRKRFAKESRQ